MEHIPTKQRIAVRAVVVRDGRLLLIRESMKYEGGSRHGFYDLPGGKIDLGETYQQALIREAREEAGIDISVGRPLYIGEWRPSVRGETLQIIGMFFLCTTTDETVTLSQDHDDYRWAGKDDMQSLPITEPVLEVIELLRAESLLS